MKRIELELVHLKNMAIKIVLEDLVNTSTAAGFSAFFNSSWQANFLLKY